MAADVHPGSFATTHRSIVLAGTQREQPGFREALGALVLCYRPAIVAFVRAYYRCDEPEAEDITQTFLTRWAENGMSGVTPDRGRFRSALRGALMPDPEGGRHFFEIMLPGAIVGALAGFVCQRWGQAPRTPAANVS